MKPRHGITVLLSSAAVACSAGGVFQDDPEPGVSSCALDADCPSGLLCRAAACVSPDDLLVPEVERERVVTRPIASPERLYLLSTDTSNVLIVDPADLSILPVPVPTSATAMVLVPGEDALAVLGRDSLAIVSFDGGAPQYRVVELDRPYHALTIAPDARYAIAYTPDGLAPADGAEGRLSIVDLERLRSGEDVTPLAIGAGYRHTNIFYRMESGVATVAVVVGKDEVALVELATGRVNRVRLPSEVAEVFGREALAVDDASTILIRSFGHRGLAVLDVDAATLSTIELPTIATDLDLAPAGDVAVAALRATNQLAFLPLPDITSSTDAIQLVEVAGARPGQVEFNADGTQLLFFSGTEEQLAVFDRATSEVRVIDRLRKKLRSVDFAPDGRSAIVLHEAEPTSSVADDYERAVDVDEGYSVVDLESGAAQLERTGTAVPNAVVYGPNADFAAITVTDGARNVHRVDRVDLDTLTAFQHPLGSAPEFIGAFGGADSRIWITQDHAAGRVSVLELMVGRLQTLTGYQLNAEIE